MYPNAPYFVVIGGHPLGYTMLMPYSAEMRDTPIDVLLLMHQIFLTLLSLSMEKEEHLRNLLDDLTSLKARRLGRREDIKQLD